MIFECEGIVLRQTKALKGRRLISIFTDGYGKVSAGTNLSEKSKSRSALAVRPFTRGRYTLKRERSFINIQSAETVKSYYSLGDDYAKFTNASLVLEFAGRMLPEDAPAPELYAETLKFLDLLDGRKRAHGTLTAAWLVKALDYAGVLPEPENFGSDKLLSALGFDTLEALTYLGGNPLEKMAALALDDEIARALIRTLLRYAERHIDIGNLKSEALLDV
jgi:DNA repair protein RecO (recombination protein O)